MMEIENKPRLMKWQKGAIGGGIATAAVVVVIVIAFSVAPGYGLFTIEDDITLYLTYDYDYWDQIGASLYNDGETYRADFEATNNVHAYVMTWVQFNYFYAYGSVGGYEYHMYGSSGWMSYEMSGSCSNEGCNVVFVFVASSYTVVDIHTTLKVYS